MLFIGILTAYLLFAIAVGKLLAYAAQQDEVWTDIRENVTRPVPTAARPARPETTRPVREKLPL